MKKVSFAVALGGALIWMGAAYAGVGPRDGQAPDGGVVAARLAYALGLDDATRGKVEAIVDRSVTQGSPLADKVREAVARLEAEHAAAHPDLKAMETEVETIADLRAQIAILRLRAGQDIEAMLTPAQIPQFRALRRDHVAERLRGAADRLHGPVDPVDGL